MPRGVPWRDRMRYGRAVIIRRNLQLSIVWRLAWRAIMYFVVLAVLVPLLVIRGGAKFEFLQFEPTIIGPFGMALAIFLAFRNSSAYDRWWEGRKLWGALVNLSRTFARQA